MMNPWKEILLSDYENRMKLSSVKQLQGMNRMMKVQFESYPVSSAVILGVAGGNGLEHIDRNKFKKVYGIDINKAYLNEVRNRYSEISDILECIELNLLEETNKLPQAELLIANLLIEYIGYACFQKTVKQVKPKYVSCIIQINTDDSFVSDSPFVHSFDRLEQIHHQIEEKALERAMLEMDYHIISALEHKLPNGKKLVQMDFQNK